MLEFSQRKLVLNWMNLVISFKTFQSKLLLQMLIDRQLEIQANRNIYYHLK